MEAALDEIATDPALDDLIPPLSTEEFVALRDSIATEGVRDPLVAWRRDQERVLLDGHNRLAIARELGIGRLPVVERAFSSVEDARLWMVQNQLGRRNLNAWQRAALVYRMRDEVAAAARERRLSGLRRGAEPSVGRNSGQRGRTDEILAQYAGMHRDTFRRASRLMEEASPDILARLDSGELSVNAASIEMRREMRRSERDAQAEERRARARQAGTVEGFRYGNCLRYLPTLRRRSVRVLLSDVPYGVAARSASQPDAFIKADDTVGSATQLLFEILRAVDHALMDDAHLLLFTSPRYEPQFRRTVEMYGYTYRGSLVWVKTDSAGNPWMGQGAAEYAFGPAHERILHYTKGAPRLIRRLPDVLLAPRPHETTHITEKPVEGLLRELILATTAGPSDRVVDPCAGTGATLLAAKQLGRQYYGCEIRRVWYEEGVARLLDAAEPDGGRDGTFDGHIDSDTVPSQPVT